LRSPASAVQRPAKRMRASVYGADAHAEAKTYRPYPEKTPARPGVRRDRRTPDLPWTVRDRGSAGSL